MIIVDIENYKEYIFNAIKIFLLTFILGRTVNKLFEVITEKYKNFNKKLMGLIQLIIIIHIAYILHIVTSQEFSEEFQISHPSILFSSFMINLQTTMFRNLGIF